MIIVSKKITLSYNDKLRSFFITETNVFYPNMYGTSSAVIRSRIALTAKRMLKS
jgi:hypothetical protein